jgi:hypothetical protein
MNVGRFGLSNCQSEQEGSMLERLRAQFAPFEKSSRLQRIDDMKRNLNDDTRRIRRCEEPEIEKRAGWTFIAAVVALVLLLTYYLLT